MSVEPEVDTVGDEELLRRFLSKRDEEAFAVLVCGHGPMVRATCVRWLGASPDADDAFQAVFLVLMRKASSLEQPRLLGPWLHTVAVRTCQRAVTVRRARQARERQVTAMPEPTTAAAEPHDWLPLLDEAVQHLPQKYRLPLILCDLEGESRAEAAARLAVPEGTLSSRLARARVLLRKRLERRGVVLTVTGLMTVLASQAPAAVPPTLIVSTSQAALAGTSSAQAAGLAEGVLHTMYLTKVKLLTVVAVSFAILFASGGLLTWQLVAQGTKETAPKSDRDALQGSWKVITATLKGQPPDADEEARIKSKPFVFKGDRAIAGNVAAYSLDTTVTPRAIDIVPEEGPEREKGHTFRGIYELKGDDLRISFRDPGQDRPKKFDDDGVFAFTLKRERK